MSRGSPSYSRSHQESARAESYDEELAGGYQGGLWETRERDLLRALLAELKNRGVRSAVDLACGTGRILELEVDAGLEATGVDISASMLGVCRRRVPEATLLQSSLADFTPNDQFPLATAFRFFTNAEPALREEGMRTAERVVEPGGYLVTNVHLQVTSPGGAARRAASLLRRAPYPRAYSWRAHRSLLEQHGFAIETIEPYGLLPNLGRHSPTWYVAINRHVETVANGRVPGLHDSVMVVARRLGEVPS